MKFLSIASKDIKELLRDRRGLFFILLFPMFFMLVFGFAFGGMGQSNTPHNIAVVNYDEGATVTYTNQTMNFGNNLTNVMEDVKYQNSDVHMFNITKTTQENADKLLKQRDVDAEVIIPKDFSRASVALITNTIQSSTSSQAAVQSTIQSTGNASTDNLTSTVIIRGDTGYMGFGTSQGILTGIFQGYQDDTVNEVQNSIKGTPGAQPHQFIETEVEGIPGTETFTSFDFLAPGMIVFAILLLATSVAASLTREVNTGTLERLKMSKMKSFDLLFGNSIPWTLVAAAQVIILFAVAIAIGFHWQGSINSIVLAVIVGVIGGISSIALGMIIAAFAKNERQASNLGTLITVPMSFMVGAFFQLPQVPIGNFMGQTFQIYDVLPWTHTLNALRSVLTYGSGWDAISYQVGMSVILTAILFVIGVFLFSRTRLRAEN
ncbi:ABC transporter permease [Methanobacterium aggregans]|uniref:ABC transporter permease n=1 Tax=Methanobacterium aggregans TaxID=1615586 RepID=UPI001AEA3E14|nr:ABC transporter permease [Methanobacterium aggregans]MBP2044811.1 ABC-2 type transport system permease protein [Methanobacterium aggregans]